MHRIDHATARRRAVTASADRTILPASAIWSRPASQATSLYVPADDRGDLFHYRAQVDAGMRVARHLSDLIVEIVNSLIPYAWRGLTAIRQTDL